MIQEPQTCENLVVLNVPCGERPCFDDERTIATARVVIPLAHIHTKSKYKRIFVLLGSFGLAMLLGTGAGLISAYFHLRAAAELPPAQEDGPSSALPEQTLPMTSAEESLTGSDNVLSVAPPVEVPTKRPTSRGVVTTFKPVTQSARHALASRARSEAEELARIRDAILNDKWQEKGTRPTRPLKRIFRSAATHASDMPFP